jgi:hypothetical protein
MQVFFNNATSKNGVTTDIYPALEQNPLGSAALLQYHVYFPSNNNTKFDWGSKGGLLPGLGYGAAAVGGCGPWDAGVSCWSVQLGWNPDGTGKIVAALPAPEQLDTFWNRVKVDGQDPETGAIIMANGTFTWKKNVWNKVGLLVIMNKVGGTDGYIELMVNDMLVFKVEVVVHRLNPDVEPDSVMLQFAYNQVPVSYDHNSTIGKVPSLNNSSNSNTSPNLMAMLKGMQLQIITPPAPPPPPPPPSPPPPSPPPPPPRQLCSFEVNVDYYGGDIKMLGNVSSSASCCNACRTTPNCAAWTYIWTKNCYLKYAGQYVKRQMYNNEYVSGVVQLQDNSLFLDDLGDGLSSLSSSLQGVCLPSQELREAAGRARATGTAKRGISIGPSSPFQLLSSSSSLEGETIVESMSISSNGDIKKFTSSSSSTPPPTDKNISIKDPCSEEQQLLQLLVAGTWWHDWKLVPHRQDLKSGNSIQTTASMLDIEYVPTVESHYASNGLDLLQTIVDSLQTQLFPAARHLMGFPAPNLQSGAAMTPEEAAALWPVIQAATDKTVILSGEGDKDGEGGNKQHQQLLLPVRLGSPIVTTCGSDCIEDYASPFDWLDAFFSLCKGCRVDFIAFSVKSCTIDGLQAQLLEMRRYGKPLWITNLACPSHATTTFNNRPMMTPLVLNAMLDVLDNDYYVERYAISSGYIGSDITDGRGAGGAGAGGEEGMPVIGRSGDDNGSSNIIDKIWRAPGSTEPSSLEEEEEEEEEKRSSSRDRTTTVVNKILPRRDNRQWTEMCQPCLFADLELQDEVVKLKCGNLCGLWVGEQDGKVGGGGSSNIIPL